MIPHLHRQKGGAPQTGAGRPGDAGPFGVRPDDEGKAQDPDDEVDQPGQRRGLSNATSDALLHT